jgi:hypothetical protein
MSGPATNNQYPGPGLADAMADSGAGIPQTLDLRDIHLPEPVSWWPPAPGWWVLFAVLCLLAAAAYISRKIYKSKQLNRDIKSELEQIRNQYSNTGNRAELAQALSILLRRACISFYPERDIAGLTGENWLAYLDESCGGSTAGKKFRSETGRILLTAPYLPTDISTDDSRLDFDAKQLIALCETWLNSPHRKKAGRAAS